MAERLSLCVITGNESAHILRMLDSFEEGFDELSLVRAIGNLVPDETEALVRQWCAANRKTLVFSDYKNAPENNWPHVDDFAAARNQSFGQATGDWLFWADCDDVIDRPDKLRELAASGQADMYRLPYDVPQSGKLTSRERLIKASLFRAGRVWRWAIHENLLVIEGDKWDQLSSPIWMHQPIGPKAGGDRRNLVILSAQIREAPTNYYYMHQENFHLGRREQATKFGKVFLSLPGRNSVLEYQCLLNLYEIADDKTEAQMYALRAHQLFPNQKEAIAAMVKSSLETEHAGAALHWSKLLVDSPALPPKERLWCYEPKWDGWRAWDLRARSLRYAGGYGPSLVEAERRVHGNKRIEFSLLHATRGRAQAASRVREMWLDLARDPQSVEHIFAIDDDDKASGRWLKSYHHVISEKRTCVAAWNLAAEFSHGSILVQVSDDFQPPKGWDAALRKEYAGRDPRAEAFAIAVSDGNRTDKLMCMAVLSRKRWEDQGREMFSSEYESMYSDNEFTHRAYRDGIVIEARHLVFEHHHPAFGKAQMDETYKRQNAPEKYKRGQETFLRRNPEASQTIAA